MHSRRSRPVRALISSLFFLGGILLAVAAQAKELPVLLPPNNSGACVMATKLYNGAAWRWQQDRKSKKADSYQGYLNASTNFESNCGMTPAEAEKR